jgi:hypothetical protein
MSKYFTLQAFGFLDFGFGLVLVRRISMLSLCRVSTHFKRQQKFCEAH